jgi:cbb3-type cytochrome oxidase subunit 3
VLESAWRWITDLGNSKIVALLLFFSTYIGILWWVFSSKRRSKRLESYKYIPFQDEEPNQSERKVQSKDEQSD